MSLYPYQEEVKDLLQQGKSVLLQIPTGGGKNRATLAPFVESFFDLPAIAFPRQCIYSVPRRVLANQFLAECEELAASYQRRFKRELDIRIQTGEYPEDPEFRGDLIFTTIDQTLSNFLNVPYALSSRRANINAGAVVSSYLVFDEFHLFPHDEEGMGALPATIQMLKLLRHVTPFVLMTATFSEEMLRGLAAYLELDEEQVITVTEADLQAIDTDWGKVRARRRWLVLHPAEGLSAQGVLAEHQTRSLAVCNVVERAMVLFHELLARGCRAVPFDAPSLQPYYDAIESVSKPSKRRKLIEQALVHLQELIQAEADWEKTTWVMLLHSRFEGGHRAVKEEFARRLFGAVAKRPWVLPSAILVSTQVIEVGLNLTGERLHTEIAPANSVLQRAGRCARFPGETGEVHVYAVPSDARGRLSYLPYPASLCAATWDALCPWDKEIVTFAREQTIINQVHGPADAALLARIRQEEGRLWAFMADAITRNDLSARGKLIRQVDSRTLIVYEPPDGKTEESPYRRRGFSFYHGTLRGRWEELQGWGVRLGLEWTLKYPVVLEEEGAPDASRSRPIFQWLTVSSADDIGYSLIFAIHPALVAYDALQGFRLVAPEAGEGGHYRPPETQTRAGKPNVSFPYQLESYTDHIRTMIGLYERTLAPRLAYVGRCLETHPDLLLLPGTLDRASRLSIVLHDGGKLQEHWQVWAQNYQKAIGEEIPPYLVAHTHSQTDAHRAAEKKVRPRRPPHALEGALAGYGVIGKGMEGQRALTNTVATAIARHHSPQASELSGEPIRFPVAAIATIQEALGVGGLPGEWGSFFKLRFDTPPSMTRYLLPPGEWLWWLIYFLLVRVVRLTDAESQEEGE